MWTGWQCPLHLRVCQVPLQCFIHTLLPGASPRVKSNFLITLGILNPCFCISVPQTTIENISTFNFIRNIHQLNFFIPKNSRDLILRICNCDLRIEKIRLNTIYEPLTLHNYFRSTKISQRQDLSTFGPRSKPTGSSCLPERSVSRGVVNL